MDVREVVDEVHDRQLIVSVLEASEEVRVAIIVGDCEELRELDRRRRDGALGEEVRDELLVERGVPLERLYLWNCRRNATTVSFTVTVTL